jgi:hypothetical protein
MNRIVTPLLALMVMLVALAPAEARRHKRHHPRHHLHRIAAPEGTTIIGSRPAGCPYRYCGCEASLFLFGKIIPALNLAANWLRFPRAEPAPMAVAARRGHVFVLLSHVEGDKWLVHDGNSGRHLTRRHVRSIRGYTIVRP